jgi:hypothetical protein
MAVTIADIAVGDPKHTIVQQLLELVRREVISKHELHLLRYTIDQESGQLDGAGVAALTYPLDGGRQVRVHKYGDSDRTHALGQTIIEKRTYASPAEEVEDRIRVLKQASPQLSRDAAQAEVFKTDHDLYDRHVMAMRRGDGHAQPLAKAAPLTDETVHQEAEALMAREEGLTKRRALARLAQEHPDEPAYSRCYRAYHLGEGLAEGTTAGEAERRVEKTVYDAMWG